MDSPISSNEKRSGLRRSARLQTPELKPENIENGSTTATFAAPANADSEHGNIPANHDENVSPKSGSVEKSTRKRKKVSPKPESKRYPLRFSLSEKVEGEGYPLRSSLGNGRVLRSMSKLNCEAEPEPEPDMPAANPVIRGRKKIRVKGASNDEFSLTRKRVRYLLNQMKYEQTLIDAYTGEGWKGQSAEKIRPEKELERAKSKILHCKFRIRELFQHLDSSSSEGRFDESLFDSEGRIDSEDIFCAKCRSKDFAVDNDIILCDGLCNRGFHQKCLNPPLLTKDIPLGDEGWLCPACECKIDCIKLLNEFQGSTISIKDTWEKFFPEAVDITNWDKSYDDLPSDDSEDSNKQTENFGLPSDDSEDDDFNPDAPDDDKSNSSKDGPSSDESDFTSDSDEFCNELGKNLGANEDTASSLRILRSTVQSGEGSYAGDENNSKILYNTAPGLNQAENVLVSGKRHRETLNYKKLHDETYGKSSSESSDDEDWSESSGMSTPSIRKKFATRKKIDGPSKANSQIGENNGYYQDPDSNGNKSSVYRRLDEIATQKLHQSFQEDQYLTRDKKESLAQELGLTYQKVDKWFVNTRHNIRASKKTKTVITPTPSKESSLMKVSITPNIETTSWSNKHEENLAHHVSITPNTETTSWSSKPVEYLAQYFSSTPNTETTNWSTKPIENFAHFVSNTPNIEMSSWSNKPAENFGGHTESEPSTRNKSVKPRKTKVGSEQGMMNMNGMDKERQKAVARELRKMKLGR